MTPAEPKRGPVYLAPIGPCPEFSEVVAAFIDAAREEGSSVGAVRPLLESAEDPLLERLRRMVPEADHVTWAAKISDWAADERGTRRRIIQTVDDMAEKCDEVFVVSDHAQATELAPVALWTMCSIAADVAAEVVFFIDSTDRDVPRLASTAIREAARVGAVVRGIIVGGDDVPGLERLGVPVQALPKHGQVRADSVTELLLQLRPESRVFVGSDHDEQLVGIAVGASSGMFPAPASVTTTVEPSASLRGLWDRLLPGVPLGVGDPTFGGGRELHRALLQPRATTLPVTPTRFEQGLFSRARRGRQRIVLCEGDEDRILRAAHIVLSQSVCEITLLGEEATILGRAKALGLDLHRADVVSPASSEWREPFAQKFAEMRAKKGMTLEAAYEHMSDVSYFGTMMVAEGRAGGMVSGAVNTTAHTIRPALQIIRTRPGISVVSSALLLCLADRVLVYGDCAVNPNPNVEQLADIAISSAQTARSFGIEPRVAMLSYSTGTSGAGPDVDKIAEATELVRERAPELAVDGPIQYDAAIVPEVGRQKAPNSPVAGRATVFIFPDLASGNIAYKAVQRSGDHLAVGPLLQGLNKPVNDLSRGSTVADIVNTVAATAIQADAPDLT